MRILLFRILFRSFPFCLDQFGNQIPAPLIAWFWAPKIQLYQNILILLGICCHANFTRCHNNEPLRACVWRQKEKGENKKNDYFDGNLIFAHSSRLDARSASILDRNVIQQERKLFPHTQSFTLSVCAQSKTKTKIFGYQKQIENKWNAFAVDIRLFAFQYIFCIHIFLQRHFINEFSICFSLHHAMSPSPIFPNRTTRSCLWPRQPKPK